MSEEIKVEETKTEEVAVPAKFAKIVEEVEKMSVLELNELVKVFEKKFGVSATAVAAPAFATGSGEVKEEKSTFNVELTDAGAQKIAVIKVIKEVLALGLKDAKDKVDAAPTVLSENMKKEDAENLKKSIEAAGGKVTLK
jgi:large subunit ribosomal protein L7/L12